LNPYASYGASTSSGVGVTEGTQGRENIATHGSTEAPSSPLGSQVANAVANAPDPVEAALADAITKASAAGRFDVVALLAGELQARREARAGNVVALDARRRGGGSQGRAE
jgi:hypothetical protein